MPAESYVELKQKKHKQEFKTDLLQETAQDTIQQSMFQTQEHRVPEQKKSEKRIKKVKRRGIVGKAMNLFEKEEEEIYGAEQEETHGYYSMERRDAFAGHLEEMTREHVTLNYTPEFTGIIRKIREFAILPAGRKNAAEKGERLTAIRTMLRDYIDRASDAEGSNPEQEKALEIIKMYRLYFETFTDGNLTVPTGAYEKSYTGENEPGFTHGFGKYKIARYEDVSDRVLFPHEPCMEDIQQGGVGDCYLLAGLASVVMKDPMIIKRSMRDNGKTVTVRFYEPLRNEEGEELGLRPVYITVNKSIVKARVIGIDLYASSSLWVQMIEKAYAAWGIQASDQYKEKERENLKKTIKDRLIKEGVTPKVAEQRASYEARERLEKKAGTYEQIVGGKSDVFLRYLTGRDGEYRQYATWQDASDVRKELTERLSAPVEDAMNLKTANGAVPAEVLQGISEVMSELYGTVADSFLRLDSGEVHKRRTSTLCIEDVQDKLKEEINKKFFTSKGKIRYNIGEEHREVIDTLVERLRQKIEETLEQEPAEGQENATGLRFVHRRDTGRYTPFAEKEYRKLQEYLNSGYYITMDTIKTTEGKGRGLNGENTSDGMVETHAYSVMATKEMDGKKFVLLRNPWAFLTQRYIRVLKPGQKETFRGEENYDSATDGVFLMEWNDFLVKAAGLRVSKGKAKELKEEDGTLQLKDWGREEAELVASDRIYAENREKQIRTGFLVKAEAEAEYPMLVKYHFPVELFASPSFQGNVVPILDMCMDMTKDNPVYIEHKAKIDAVFQKLMGELVKKEQLLAQRHVLSLSEQQVKRALDEQKKAGAKSPEVVKHMETLGMLYRLYKNKREQLEKTIVASASDELYMALAHLMGELELEEEQVNELKEKGFI